MAIIIRLKVQMDWKTKRVLFVGKVHKWYGRGIILTNQFVIGSGALCFYEKQGNKEVGWIVAGVSSAVFFLVLLIGEITYQCMLRRKVEFVQPTAIMSADDF